MWWWWSGEEGDGESGVCMAMMAWSEGGRQEEHLRLSWHQVLFSCLNESNLSSLLPPSLTKQISFCCMFQSAESAPSSTPPGSPVMWPIVHQSSPLSHTNWHKISPILSSPCKKMCRLVVFFPYPSVFPSLELVSLSLSLSHHN